MTTQYRKTPDAPATHLEAVTPSDSTTYDPPLRALFVGGAGNLAVIAEDDAAAVTMTGVPAGSLVPVMVKKVMSTSTTATNIVGLR